MGVHSEFADLASLYALGALQGAEKVSYEAHLAVCVMCATEVRAVAPVATALASTAPAATPSPDVRRAVLSQIRGRRQAQTHWLAMVASAVLAVGFAGYAALLRGRVTAIEGRLEEATRQADASQRRMAELRHVAFDAQSTVAVLAAPDLARVDLAGQPVAPAAQARVFWSRASGLVFTASNLPAVPAGRTYQLWVLTSRPEPISAGLLKPDASGRVTAVFTTPSDLPKPVAMAVTLEPEGGVLSPTGDKYLVGLAN